MGKQWKLQKTFTQVFAALLICELTLQWIHPGHHRVPLEFKNTCFIFIHRWVSELRMFVYVAVMKVFPTIFL